MRRITALMLVIFLIFTSLQLPSRASKVEAAENIPEGYTPIYTIEDLYNVRNNLSGNYILMNDINLKAATSSGGGWDYNGNGWDPIGSGGIYGATAFSGVFDGANHTINGLTIRGKNLSAGMDEGRKIYVGLFAYNTGTIKNIVFTNTSISINFAIYKSTVYCGTVAAVNSGSINNCIVDTSFESSNLNAQPYGFYPITTYVAGIANGSEGTISYCSNVGTIERRYEGKGTTNRDIIVCGIGSGEVHYSYSLCEYSGFHYGTIYGIGDKSAENCYDVSTIIASGETYFDFCGVAKVAKHCYAAGAYDACTQAIGSNATECYYRSKYNNTSTGAKALTDAQMRLASMYVGFDFDNVWVLDKVVEYPYPQLRNNRQDADKFIDSIEWSIKPTKTDYYIGDAISATGGKITVYYQDNTHETIDLTEDMLSGYTLDAIGKETVTVTYRDFTLTYDIYVTVKPSIINMELVSIPTKTEFVRDTVFDFSGSRVHIDYEDGSNEEFELTPDMTTGGNITKSGEQTITFSRDGFEVSFQINVVPVKESRLILTSKPDKLKYIEGQNFDATGIKGVIEYNNGTTIDMLSYTVSGYESTPGTHTVTITSSNVSASFDVTVEKKIAVSISVKKQPDKLSYIVGQTFDATGMEVVATYNDGTTATITDFTVDELPMEAGIKSIYVYYQDVKTAFSVSMIARQVISIAVTNMPYKTKYIEEEVFCTDGLKVTAKYNDGTTEEVTDYTVTGANTMTIGTHTVTVSYSGKATTFNITVIESELMSISVVEPEKTDYNPGDALDPTGMKVYGTYNNGLQKEISEYEISDYTGDKGTNLVKISVGELEYSFAVTVHDPEDEWSMTLIPDCTQGGQRVKYCRDCGKVVMREDVPPIGHSPVVVKGKEATCVEKGYTDSSYCEVCSMVLKEAEVIPAKEHTPSNTWDVVTRSGCTSQGTQVRVCTACGETLEVKEINATGHAIVIDEAIPATCTKSGMTQGAHCSVCNEVIVAQVATEPKGHTVDSAWTEVIPVGCSTNGLRVKKCLICDESVESEVAVQMGHFFQNYKSNHDATCTKDGTKTAKCEYCDVENTIPDEGSAIGHIPVLVEGQSPTCTEAGWTEGSVCTVCGENVVQRQVLAPTGHTAVEDWVEVTAASCTKNGVRELYCKDCGTVLDSKVVAQLGHAYHNYKSNNDATCTDDGTKTAECIYCGAKKTIPDEGSALGHIPVLVEGQSPTCTEAGWTEGSVCTVCGENVVQRQVLAPTGHTAEDEWVEVLTSSCEQKGRRELRCKDCGTVLDVKESDHLSHQMVKYVHNSATCTTAGCEQYWQCDICRKLYKDALGQNETTMEDLLLPALGHQKLTYYAASESTYTSTGNREYWYCEDCGKYYGNADCTLELTRNDTVMHANSLVAKQKVDISTWFVSSEPIAKYVVYPKSAATVSSKGILTAKQPGNIVVTAYVKHGKDYVALEDTISLTIEKPEFEFNLIPNKRGQTLFAANYMLGCKNAQVTMWSVPSSKSPVVAIDAMTGEITVLKSGNVKVTAVFGDGKNTVKYTTILKVKLPTLSKTKLSLKAGKNSVLKVKGTTLAPTEWISDNEEVATVDSAGKVTALKPGIATISAVIDGVDYSCTVTVK